MIRYMKKHFIPAFFALLLVSTVAMAQQSARIGVTVHFPDQSPAFRATVSLLRTDSSIISVETTNESGKTQFSNLPSGGYLLRITNIGYRTFVKNIDLKAKS